MQPREDQEIETLNTEQQDDAQVLDASDMEERDATALGGEETARGNIDDLGEVAPDDRPDLVETIDSMTASGRIDNSAFEGERTDDDEESMYGDTETEDEGLDDLTIIEDTDLPAGSETNERPSPD